MARKLTKTPELTLRLYVAGAAPNSMRARTNLEAICARLGCPPALEVIDLMVEPARGLADRILVTPTLVKAAPAPIRRVIGDLRDATHVLLLLGHK